MSVVFQRPYQFVPPDRNPLWPWLIQRLRIVDRYLKRKDGVVGYECRNLDRVRQSAQRGDGILWAPNHCRYADPLVLGWPSRELGIHVHAMASWHLFNEGAFDRFAIRKMGGFSIHREGTDRQALESAIDILVDTKRPLVLFPEGTTSRTNDLIIPLLDGVSFIARTAARRRAKSGSGDVMIFPVGIKYLCIDKIDDWAKDQLSRLERSFGWKHPPENSIPKRTIRLSETILALHEIRCFGESSSGDTSQRRAVLIQHLLSHCESVLQIQPSDRDVASGDLHTWQRSVLDRVRQIRSAVASKYFAEHYPSPPCSKLVACVDDADLAQEQLSTPDDYLGKDVVTDTRIVESIQLMQESLFGKSDASLPLKAVVEFGEPIPVPSERAPRGEEDPLMGQLRERLTNLVGKLSHEARKWSD
ncbi:1-acyl-sn-glycerol-3-phosphate acyltransferase [Stieleria varia]|uniref:Acyltransferase n=1 Tax=Stieleria varia TaxID=2528005 RepID=A0A5C6B2N5_9BACT|nr:1-acyl-sn-glycerol-3-phosphate acyltransferase [Stieleria varia]TWU05722.1 Acyltransferase [Stieleria varia]